jgi:xylulokinase
MTEHAMDHFLCIDLGSSGAKSSIVNKDGELVGMVFKEYRFVNPQPFWSEIDPNVIWQNACAAIKEVCLKTNISIDTIVGISISMIGETVMMLDKDCIPVYPAIESMDARDNGYFKEVSFWKEKVGAEKIFSITSYPLSSLASVNKILWFRENHPDQFAQVEHVATFQDFIIYKLTGKLAIDYSMASRTMLFDVSKKVWSKELLSSCGLDQKLFSDPYPAYTVIGGLTDQAAHDVGLRKNTPVILGAHDQACASLGVGIVGEGIAMDGTGSVEAIIVPTKKPIQSKEMMAVGHGSQCHVTGDVYLGIGFHLTAGLLVRWYKDQIALEEQHIAQQTGKDIYDLITEGAAKSVPGSNGLLLLPHFQGAGTGRTPPLNPLSRGLLIGLKLSNTRDDISRAVFEGITFETKLILTSMEKAGISIDQLRVTGGGAKSDFWLQLKADMTGKKVVVTEVTEASSLGTALLIGTGLGLYGSLEDAVNKTVHLKSEFKPDPRKTQVYDRLFQIYQTLYPNVEKVFEDLNKFITETKL